MTEISDGLIWEVYSLSRSVVGRGDRKDLEQGLLVTTGRCVRMEVKREALRQISSTSQVLWC